MDTRKTQTILVVDPDPAIRALMVALLRREGYVAEAAESAAEALRLGRTRHHAAVVLEPRMPDGEALLDALHAVAGDGGPNVIVVTTPDGAQPPYAATPGVRAVLLKPFRLDELANAVATCCTSSTAATQS